MIFFLNDEQQRIVEQALSRARDTLAEKTKAARSAAALTEMAQYFIRKEQKDED